MISSKDFACVGILAILAGCADGLDKTPRTITDAEFAAPANLRADEVAVRFYYPAGGNCVSDTPAGRFETKSIPGVLIIPRGALSSPIVCTTPDGDSEIIDTHVYTSAEESGPVFLYIKKNKEFVSRR